MAYFLLLFSTRSLDSFGVFVSAVTFFQKLVGAFFQSWLNLLLLNFSSYRTFLRHSYFLYKSTHERDEINLFQKLIKPGFIIFDVGSGWGFYTRLFSRLVGESGLVYSFEPSKTNFLFLQAMANRESLGNVNLIMKAVSDTSKIVDFYFDFKNPANSRVLEGSAFTKVATCTLDDFAIPSDTQCLLKVDVQGHEIEVLRGAKQFLQNRKLSLFVEFDNDFYSDKSKQVFDFLLEEGFLPYAIQNTGELQALKEYPQISGYFNLFWEKNSSHLLFQPDSET